MAQAAKRRGRPTKIGVSGDRVSLGLRVTADLKQRLDAAATASGRSQSQEAEFRLERSFVDDAAFPSPEIRFWAHYVAGIFHERGAYEASLNDHKDWTDKQWMSDPGCYQAAFFSVIRSLILKQPKADRPLIKLLLSQLTADLLGASKDAR